ncbi:hypothetical protein BESB_080700 [Besnoitia besnoiti]|uniref:Uncharacterized protein n=1 Tax=Besnoitia besnoiti TaxID=94643 RepID=A0A2A9M9H3_BESBE|nr:hypothetical protein BESB_080700 [Besnoitia besnoiti]PFH33854.1 hypothetical protein BESB_080700 [Besnoitia besnoiti]
MLPSLAPPTLSEATTEGVGSTREDSFAHTAHASAPVASDMASLPAVASAPARRPTTKVPNSVALAKSESARRTPAAFSVHRESKAVGGREFHGADIKCLETALRGECVSCKQLQADADDLSVVESPTAAADPSATAESCEPASDGIPYPVIVRDSFSYWVIYKPPFWSCKDGLERQGDSLGTENAEDATTPTVGSVIGYLQKHFPVTQASAIYNCQINNGLVYPLETEWSGFIVVAKTFNGYVELQKQLQGGEMSGAFHCVIRGTHRKLDRITEIPLLRGYPGTPCLSVTRTDLIGSLTVTSPPAPDSALRLPHEESSHFLEVPDDQLQYQTPDTEVWFYVSLECQLLPGSDADSVPEKLTPAFWSCEDEYTARALSQKESCRPCRRVFCHGTALSFRDIDGGKQPIHYATRRRWHNAAEESHLPLAKFECALPVELEEVLAEFQKGNYSRAAAMRDPRESQLSTKETETAHKLRLFVGSLGIVTVGALLCWPWVASNSRLASLSSPLSSLPARLSQAARNGVSSLLAMKNVLLCTSLFGHGALSGSLPELQMRLVRLLPDASTDSPPA